VVRSQPGKIAFSQKNSSQKRVGRVAQDIGPEFEPQYHKKEKKKKDVRGTFVI
jgi:hypothetical protein